MPPIIEELAAVRTELGELVLRRRLALELGGTEVYEVKLNEEFLMSSHFTAGEIALATKGLEAVSGEGLQVVVGGLGLGYTAATALDDERVSELLVVDALQPVIDWHLQELVPNGTRLARDPRCRLQQGDFFAMAFADGFDPGAAGRAFDAILLDIDHTPSDWLHPDNARLYTEEGLACLRSFLRPGGVFALWSNDAPEAEFTRRLDRVFSRVIGHTVPFENTILGEREDNGVYVAIR